MIKNNNLLREKAAILLIVNLLLMVIPLRVFSIYDTKIQRAQSLDMMEPLLREVQSKFHLEGKPIHPLIIQFFQNPISDLAQPYRLALDLNMAYNTNLFPATPTSFQDSWISNSLSDNVTFKYQYLGRLSNGLHVVISAENQGGSLTLYTLSAFHISLDWALQSSGQPYIRLKMEIYFQMPLDFFEWARIDDNAVHIFYGNQKSIHIIEAPRRLIA